MSLTNLREILSKAWKPLILILVLIVGALLVFWWFNRANTIYGKLPTPKFNNVLVSQPVWVASVNELTTVNSVSVFKIVKNSYSVKEATDLAIKLGFDKKSDFLVGNNLRWHKESRELIINLGKGSVEFRDTLSSKQSAEIKGVLNRKELIEKSRVFLEAFVIENDYYDFDSPEITYALINSTSFHPGKVEEGKANLLTAHFPRRLNGKDVYTYNGRDEIVVSVFIDGRIIAVDLSKASILDEGAIYPLLNSNEVEEKIVERKGYFVTFKESSENESFNLINNPSQIVVGDGQMVYYRDFINPYLQPIYSFNAVTAKAGKGSKGTVYLPAIKDDFLKTK